MNLVLDAAYLLAAAATAPWWLRKKRGAWAERFGHTSVLPAKTRPRVMLHAVSVGEVNLIRALVDVLRADADVVVASTTDTGAARAKELFLGKAHLVRYPLDASWSVRRFLDAVDPDVVALVELELWPNFASECRRRGIPLGIVNGRLSDRSHGRYRMARPILGRHFGSLAFLAAQDSVYAERFLAAGARRDRTTVAGSMKWDAASIEESPRAMPGVSELAREMGIDLAAPIVVAGSTAPEEHALLHAATPPGAQLVCAPRRPEWWSDAERELPLCVRRSRVRAGAAPRPHAERPRFLLDTIGELRLAYALADVVVIGRSFGALHGSDPMEPAGLGRPIIIGPSHADFRAAVGSLHDAGALMVVEKDALGPALSGLLADTRGRAEMGRRAIACVRDHQGATERTRRLILDAARARARGAP